MSVTDFSQQFFQSAQTISLGRGPEETQDTWINYLLSSELPDAISEAQRANRPRQALNECLLVDTGEMVMHLLHILSQLAHNMIYGRRMVDYSELKVKELREREDLSDLTEIDYIHTKHNSLK